VVFLPAYVYVVSTFEVCLFLFAVVVVCKLKLDIFVVRLIFKA